MPQPDVASGPTCEYKTRNQTETFNPHQLPQKKHFPHNNPKLQGLGRAQTKTKSLLETTRSEPADNGPKPGNLHQKEPPSIKPNPIKPPKLLYTKQNFIEETSEPIGNQEPNPNQQAPVNPTSKPIMRTKEAPKQSQNQLKTKPKLKTQPRIFELFKPIQDLPLINPVNATLDITKTTPREPTQKPANQHQTLSHQIEPPDCDTRQPPNEKKKPNYDTVGGTSAKNVNKPPKPRTKVVHASDIKLFLQTKRREREMKNKLSLEGNNKTVINQPPSEPCDDDVKDFRKNKFSEIKISTFFRVNITEN